ncbi:hypothetical protein RhiJN_26652 [Ceratobasidium sp. AG-Ba]|nr:hypothetical protein RhiJN_12600 [Ceratobasidium sp. AG-Ba]QRV98633.1 hypothetical protein RhiJN_26652 [Ceratobasidium sp. AG-Ba]
MSEDDYSALRAIATQIGGLTGTPQDIQKGIAEAHGAAQTITDTADAYVDSTGKLIKLQLLGLDWTFTPDSPSTASGQCDMAFVVQGLNLVTSAVVAKRLRGDLVFFSPLTSTRFSFFALITDACYVLTIGGNVVGGCSFRSGDIPSGFDNETGSGIWTKTT